MKYHALVRLFVLPLLSPALALAANPVVRVATPLGSFDIELCSEISELCLGAAPNSVGNFLGFVERGDYEGSIVHRSVPPDELYPGFVLQGGGFRREGPAIIQQVPSDPDGPIANEFNQSNVRGTVAIPLFGDLIDACDTDENSGTSGWFVNIDDTNSFLDCGLFTVFGVVIGEGMDVVDAINQLPVANIDAPRIDPLFDPPAISGAFRQVPFRQEFVDLLPLSSEDPLPPLEDFADAFISTDITRVPEPAGGAGGAAALVVIAALGRHQRTP